MKIDIKIFSRGEWEILNALIGKEQDRIRELPDFLSKENQHLRIDLEQLRMKVAGLSEISA